MAFEDIHRPLTAAGFRGAIKWIIIVSGATLVLQHVPGLDVWLVKLFGLSPAHVLRDYWLWQPFTYLFMHAGIFHWLFNMFVLWMFGRELEVRWGTPFFIRYFFTCGAGAAACFVLLSRNSPDSLLIGASGAIFGLLVAFAMVFPEAVLYLYFVIPVKAWQAVVLFGVIELFAGFEGGGRGLSQFAHLGGMATGYLYLRSGELFAVRSWSPFHRLREWLNRKSFRQQRPVVFHEVTDDLVVEVDRILEKILKDGVDSLTSKEKQIMERYSKLKH